MAKHLTESNQKAVVSLIENWEGKLTWNKLVAAFESLPSGHVTTRQTLSSYQVIKTAWNTVKDPSTEIISPKAASLAMAQTMIEKRDIKIAVLENQLSLYEEQFMRWLYNSRKSGITIDHLNQALPKNPINSTEE